MKFKTQFIIFFIFLSQFFLSSPVTGAITTATSTNYVMVHDSVTTYSIDEANNYCFSNYGANAASIHSTLDNNEVTALFSVLGAVSTERALIGLIDWSSAWRWLDGTPFDFDNWGTGEPNAGASAHVQIQVGGEWFDELAVQSNYFVCNLPEDVTSPSITISSPINSSIALYSNDVSLIYSVSDGTTVVYLDDFANVSSMQSGFVMTGLSEGSHNVTITATDLAGNTGRDTVIFDIDRTPPTVVIESPIAGNYSIQSIYLNYTTSPGLTTVYFDGLANSTAIRSGTLYSGVTWGWHNFTVSTSDTAGNTGRDTVRFRLIEPISPTTTSTTISTTTSTTISTTTSITTTTSDATTTPPANNTITTTSENSQAPLGLPGFGLWITISSIIILVIKRKT